MGKLYWKIFLGFWAAMVAIVAITSWSVSLLVDDDPRPRDSGRERRMDSRLAHSANTAEHLLRYGGEQALVEWLRSQRGRKPLIVNSDGVDILGRRLAPSVRQAVSPGSTGVPPGAVPVHSVVGPDGASYRLLFPLRGRRFVPPQPQVFALRLGLAILVSGAVCWWLARYLTAPLGKLQTATRALSAGQLSVRVRPELGPRNDEVGALGEDFDRMAERLQQLLEAQARLLRDVSHELRSPLARLQVALGLARRGGEGQTSALDRIEHEAVRVDELIGQLLTLTRLESGASERRQDRVRLDRLLSSVAADAGFESTERNRRVSLESNDHCEIDGDEALLRSALDNLVRNAVRHTLENTCVELALEVQSARHEAVISIRDHGPGVPEEFLSRLFDPFFRVEDDRNRNSGGQGLGLAIALRALRQHGGSIQASNNLGGGLTMTVRIPLHPDQSGKPTTANAVDTTQVGTTEGHGSV